MKFFSDLHDRLDAMSGRDIARYALYIAGGLVVLGILTQLIG